MAIRKHTHATRNAITLVWGSLRLAPIRRGFIRDGRRVGVCEKDGGEGGGKRGRINVCRGVTAREKDERRVTGEKDKCVRW